MVDGDDPKPSDWGETAPAPRKARRGGRHFRRLGLRDLMIALVYFALVSWAGRQVSVSDQAIHRVLLAVLIGLGIAAVGLWGAVRLTRYGFLGWIAFVIGYLIATTATISAFSIPALPILIGAIVYITGRWRATNQEALLWVLRVTSDRGMPLEPAVRAFAGQAHGLFRLWAGSLADLLHQGVTLPDAIESVPKVVPRSSSFLIRVGAESGRLSEGLREATLHPPGGSPIVMGLANRVTYLVWVVLIAQAIVGFLLYFIIPKFEAIFKDFGVELPELTRFIIGASHVVVEYAWVGFLPVLAFLIYLPIVVLSSSGTGFPLVDRLFPRRHTDLILRAFSVVVGSGRAIVPTLRAMAETYPTGWVRRRLHQAALYAEQGIDWSDALYSCGLINRRDRAVIEAATRASNLPWALRELAESGERRRLDRLQVWSQLLFVAAILGLGGLVFVLAVAFFLPLTTLIQRLAP